MGILIKYRTNQKNVVLPCYDKISYLLYVVDSLFFIWEKRNCTRIAPKDTRFYCTREIEKTQNEVCVLFSLWSGRRDSNSRHAAWEAAALPLSYTRMITRLLQHKRCLLQSHLKKKTDIYGFCCSKSMFFCCRRFCTLSDNMQAITEATGTLTMMPKTP